MGVPHQRDIRVLSWALAMESKGGRIVQVKVKMKGFVIKQLEAAWWKRKMGLRVNHGRPRSTVNHGCITGKRESPKTGPNLPTLVASSGDNRAGNELSTTTRAAWRQLQHQVSCASEGAG